MFKSKYHLGEMFGIPIYVDISFAFLLLAFMMSQSSIVSGATCAIILAISIVLHELGHSLTARLFGYRTRDITISLLGGCASLIALPRKGWQEFLTALAGPLVSFALAAAGWFSFTVFNIENAWLAFALSYLCWLNLMLGAFNLLPGFPLDGGRIFRSVLLVFFNRSKATFIAMWVGRVFAILLGISGLHAIVSGGSWGFIRILIAWMIWQEGYREYLLARMESSWDYHDFRARVSPPPYGGRGDDCDVTKN
jgi:Zn-dependent protease